MAKKTVDEFLMNAKSVQFVLPETEKEPPIVFVVFEDMNIGTALYSEVIRTHKEYPQYLGFKKSHSSLILSFIISSTDEAHAKMLLDYNEGEFNVFTSKIKTKDPYVLVFGRLDADGKMAIGIPAENIIVFHRYELK